MHSSLSKKKHLKTYHFLFSLYAIHEHLHNQQIHILYAHHPDDVIEDKEIIQIVFGFTIIKDLSNVKKGFDDSSVSLKTRLVMIPIITIPAKDQKVKSKKST